MFDIIVKVFFGGGTPSIARPETFASILDYLSSRTILPPGTEVTMEANPSVTPFFLFIFYININLNDVLPFDSASEYHSLCYNISLMSGRLPSSPHFQ